jgi:hypothetical protein
VHEYFGGMRSGEVRRLDGRPYRWTGDYVNVFKSFWHWYMKVERRAGRTVPDICLDLDYRSDRAPWVYLTEADVDLLCRTGTGGDLRVHRGLLQPPSPALGARLPQPRQVRGRFEGFPPVGVGRVWYALRRRRKTQTWLKSQRRNATGPRRLPDRPLG